MTFRVRHEWPEKSTRIVDAELVTCPHCHTLRVTTAGKPTRFLRRVPCATCAVDPKKPHDCERDRETEPPCIEPPPPPKRAGARGRDRIGCEFGPLALERAKREAIDRGRDQG